LLTTSALAVQVQSEDGLLDAVLRDGRFGFPAELRQALRASVTGGCPAFPGCNGGFSPFGDGLTSRCNCPLVESEQQVQFVNNWTRTQGNHSIKFGAAFVTR